MQYCDLGSDQLDFRPLCTANDIGLVHSKGHFATVFVGGSVAAAFCSRSAFLELWSEREGTVPGPSRRAFHEGEQRAVPSRGVSALTDVRQRIGVEALRRLGTNIFALLGDLSLFDDGKMRNGTGI